MRLIAEGKMDPISQELFDKEEEVVKLGKRPQCTIETFFKPIAKRNSPANPAKPPPVAVSTPTESKENLQLLASPFFPQPDPSDLETEEEDCRYVSLLPKLVPLESPPLAAELLEQLCNLTCPKVVRAGMRAPV